MPREHRIVNDSEGVMHASGMAYFSLEKAALLE
jgi:hypothetical protein